MTLDEWQEISGRLFSAFPSSSITKENLAAYFMDLADEDARDVAGAAAFFREHGGAFPPSLPELVRQVATERACRLEHERRPDFTGVAALPPAEQERIHLAGVRASIGIDGDPPAELEQIADRTRARLDAGEDIRTVVEDEIAEGAAADMRAELERPAAGS